MDARMLRKAGRLTKDEHALIVRVLDIMQDAEPRPFVLLYAAAHLIAATVYSSSGKFSHVDALAYVRSMVRASLRTLRK